jgi:hypothetical protein
MAIFSYGELFTLMALALFTIYDTLSKQVFGNLQIFAYLYFPLYNFLNGWLVFNACYLYFLQFDKKNKYRKTFWAIIFAPISLIYDMPWAYKTIFIVYSLGNYINQILPLFDLYSTESGFLTAASGIFTFMAMWSVIYLIMIPEEDQDLQWWQVLLSPLQPFFGYHWTSLNLFERWKHHMHTHWNLTPVDLHQYRKRR